MMLESVAGKPSSYETALRALGAARVPFLVGGAFALAFYCGINRDTKDLDVFLLPGDVARALEVLRAAGFRTETPFPHWLAKAHWGGEFIDVIFCSGNGSAPVDAEWFAHAHKTHVLSVEVSVCPAEETIWTKAFVMERERFDGADVAHLLLARGPSLDWDRLLRRFGDHWRVLLAHLVLFAYVFPDEAERVPRDVVAALSERCKHDACHGEGAHVCCGTLLSREQYLPDLARGWRDARLPPIGAMTPADIAIWTDAITPRR